MADTTPLNEDTDEIIADESPQINFNLCNEADNATLNFFTNPMYLGMINKKMKATTTDNKKKAKFYRKRIQSLFKDLIKEEESPTQELKELYDRFVNSAIHYFEMVDKKDIIQGQHTIENNAIENHAIENNAIEEDSVNAIEEDSVNAIEEDSTIDQANNRMMKKNIQFANLDNYIITKHDPSSADVRIIPLKIEIDLKNPELKTKGIKPKKYKKSINMVEDLSQ